MAHARAPGGARIHYETWGDGDAVVLLHPNHATGESWAALGWDDALAARGFRAIAIDARGFGASDAVLGAADLAPGRSSDEIAAVLAAVGIAGAAHVVGYSLGAAHALRFAHDPPSRVRSLVLGGLAIGPLVQCGLALGGDAEAARGRALADAASVRLLSEADRRYFAAVRDVIASAPLRPLGAASLPRAVLLVAGERDRFAPLSFAASLGAAGAHVETREIPGATHGEGFTDARFRDAALDFLARQPRPV